MPVEPKLAATVILLRERKPDVESGDDCEFEVFMAKRHKDAKFMSEHHVFPGGSIDKQDSTEVSKGRLVGVDDGVINNLKDVCENPENLWIGATREVFEEAGILVATNNTGDSLGKLEKKTKKLKKYDRSSLITEDGVIRQTMHGLGLAWSYFPHAFHVKCGNMTTPYEAFIDDQIFLNVIYKRLKMGTYISDSGIRKMLKIGIFC